MTFLLISIWTLHAQVKYEREQRISIDEVPEHAKKSISETPLKDRVKWYREESNNGVAIEAKGKYQASRYSIEFSPDGDLLDVEIEEKWRKLPSSVTSLIDRVVSALYTDYKVCKFQYQYTGSPELLLHLFSSEMITPDNFEIVAKVKINDLREEREFLISADGHLIKEARIVEKNNDILEY